MYNDEKLKPLVNKMVEVGIYIIGKELIAYFSGELVYDKQSPRPWQIIIKPGSLFWIPDNAKLFIHGTSISISLEAPCTQK